MAETIEEGKGKVNWHSEKESRMSEAEAHDEANMMRAEAGVAYRGGKAKIVDKRSQPVGDYDEYQKTVYGYIHRKPTIEDYDKASAVIGQLKEAASKEPDWKKNVYKILRGADHVVQAILEEVGILSLMGVSVDTKRLYKSYGLQEENILNNFQDAEKKLRDLKKLGEKFGRDDRNVGKSTAELPKS